VTINLNFNTIYLLIGGNTPTVKKVNKNTFCYINTLTSETKGKPGHPKGSKNRNKTEVVLTDTLKQIQSMLKTVLATIDGFILIRYFLLDGYFGNNHTLGYAYQIIKSEGNEPVQTDNYVQAEFQFA
jgi:hypothetical protein